MLTKKNLLNSPKNLFFYPIEQEKKPKKPYITSAEKT